MWKILLSKFTLTLRIHKIFRNSKQNRLLHDWKSQPVCNAILKNKFPENFAFCCPPWLQNGINKAHKNYHHHLWQHSLNRYLSTTVKKLMHAFDNHNCFCAFRVKNYYRILEGESSNLSRQKIDRTLFNENLQNVLAPPAESYGC